MNVEILIAGDGKRYPKAGNTVIIHYDAFLPNGVQFDSSRERNKPFKFVLFCEQVIPGLDEGVSQLSMGERAMISIPSSKAYGAKGFPCLVPKNTDLTFDVELMGFDT
jgi:FKBP-type peptidyl-prolyl cis-trans isomerase